MYQQSYHHAMNAIIAGSGTSARPLIARALRDLRNGPGVWSDYRGKRINGRERAREARYHMQFVSGLPWLRS